jgi:SAM-dependent methyltransferase
VHFTTCEHSSDNIALSVIGDYFVITVGSVDEECLINVSEGISGDVVLVDHSLRGSRLSRFLAKSILRVDVNNPFSMVKYVKKDVAIFMELEEKDLAGSSVEILTKGRRMKMVINEHVVSELPESAPVKINVPRLVKLLVKYTLSDMDFGPGDRFIRLFRGGAAERAIRSTGSQRILDVGCGRQAYLGWRLSDAVESYTGLDRDIPEANIKNTTFVKSTAELMPEKLSNVNFDGIMALALIEHLDSPEEFLRDCSELLQGGGYLVMTTPTPVANPVLDLISRVGLINRDEIEEHKYYFNIDEVNGMLRKLDFEVEESRKFMVGFNSIFVARKKN